MWSSAQRHTLSSAMIMESTYSVAACLARMIAGARTLEVQWCLIVFNSIHDFSLVLIGAAGYFQISTISV